jgi:2-dehydro-3-deoxyglucarate aldolase
MPNRFRRELLAGKTLIGCWVSLCSSLTTELLGYAGFDWLLLDGEHAPNDYGSFIAQLQALKDSPSAPIVRPQWQDPVVIKRLLDVGFFNFLIPFVESAEQAQRAVQATRYPPQGIRGVGTGGILAPIEADARKYLEMGMTFVAVGGDVGLLRGAATSLSQKFKAK